MEASGKLFVIGMYNDILAFESYPHRTSLKLMITVVSPLERPFKRLAFRAYHGERVVFAEDIPDEVLKQAESEAASESVRAPNYGKDWESTVPIHQFRLFFTIPPFEITQASALRIRVETEAETLAAGALALQSIESLETED